MDFEFDKEIDVLLRQARKGETVFAATTPQTAHLDADEISAFAENALPEKAKQHLYGAFGGLRFVPQMFV